MRECDKETHRRFGARDAGAYPANRTNMGRYTGGKPRGEVLLERLARRGFRTASGLAARRGARGRWVFECYPHPAQVVLFALPKTLKYKRKRQGLAKAPAEFARYLEHVRALRRPKLLLDAATLQSLDVSNARGKAYKDCEDRLDALFCAYLAALADEGRLELLGRPEQGSIAVVRE